LLLKFGQEARSHDRTIILYAVSDLGFSRNSTTGGDPSTNNLSVLAVDVLALISRRGSTKTNFGLGTRPIANSPLRRRSLMPEMGTLSLIILLHFGK
jgi:hypothetical protein